MIRKAEMFRRLAESAGWRRGTAAHPAEKAAGARGARAGKKAQYALEASAGRPSRKSTRRSANRQKTDVQFRMKRRVGEVRAQDRPRTSR